MQDLFPKIISIDRSLRTPRNESWLEIHKNSLDQSMPVSLTHPFLTLWMCKRTKNLSHIAGPANGWCAIASQKVLIMCDLIKLKTILSLKWLTNYRTRQAMNERLPAQSIVIESSIFRHQKSLMGHSCSPDQTGRYKHRH